MRFIFLLAAFLAISPLSAMAQDSAPSPDAGVDELIRILENEEARNALLSRLKAQASAAPVASPEAQAAAAQAEAAAEPTLARQIAEQTRDVAEQAARASSALWSGIAGLGDVVNGTSSINYDVVLRVALVGVGLFASFFLLRLVVLPIHRALERRAVGRHWPLRLTLAIVATGIDVLTIALAWGAGYLLALRFIGGSTGQMGINQTLLLNAFLMVEIIKVVLRALLQPRFPAFRFIGWSDTSAAYWYFWSARAVSLIGYTFMFVAPIMAANVSPAAAQAVRVLVMLTALVIGVIVVLQNRERVRTRLAVRASHGHNDTLGRAGAAFAGVWHLIAIFYLFAVFVVWLVNPREALPFMLAATVQSIMAVVIGGLIVAFISRFVNVGMKVPDDVRARLPALEGHLQAFVPRVMQVVRTMVLIGIVIAIAQAWGLIDFLGWAASESGQRVTGSVISSALILIVGFVIYVGMSSWVEYRLNPSFGAVPTPREKTLLALFRNAFTIVLVVMVSMLALAQIGVNIAPLLAGAGVLGLAIGFGAQKLVQDIITGVFIQLENVMNEGDSVKVGSVGGTVEKLTIRSVSIRDGLGTLHLIPFSSVDVISNNVKGFSVHTAEFGVSYDENIGEVKQALKDAFARLMETEHREVIIEPLGVDGLVAFNDSSITVRCHFKTLANRQWAASRLFNEYVKEVFDERGISMPYPHVTLYMGADKKGKAPPMFVKDVSEAQADETETAEGGADTKAGDAGFSDVSIALADAPVAAKPVRRRAAPKKPAKPKLLPPPSKE